ncbi:MAG: transcriptional repressor [Candidatus Kerfeldbacteria bacterium]|nr:transcriptional repressor [Candidatus Kerfeldbacteria bacterium]
MPATRVAKQKTADKTWRLTNQRMVILSYLRATPGHHSAEQIYGEVKKKMPSMSFATVYRNLNFLRDYGYIQETVINKISRYDGRIDAHVHLLCENCGKVVNVDHDSIFESARRLAKQQHFISRMENIELRGLCEECRAKGVKIPALAEGQCQSCGKLKKDILQAVLECGDCRFNNSCLYYQEAHRAHA